MRPTRRQCAGRGGVVRRRPLCSLASAPYLSVCGASCVPSEKKCDDGTLVSVRRALIRGVAQAGRQTHGPTVFQRTARERRDGYLPAQFIACAPGAPRRRCRLRAHGHLPHARNEPFYEFQRGPTTTQIKRPLQKLPRFGYGARVKPLADGAATPSVSF